ncbi:hypothetical protein CCY99_06260 [Helicobacter sp. 16-1353]|uniref:hypothetical protein n=1 Tax=Helicobacter sp. 16-1353 TaxID=2004996 RepID=UPI000DCDD85B|nr:hypothetical protein [Helicobacter sp. 16-1353]RAX53191.1 hypothetical protein CCY99_06260 [Helicobacter sp. 16-1353]
MNFKNYWEKYYKKHKNPEGNSLFAEFVLGHLQKQLCWKDANLHLIPHSMENGEKTLDSTQIRLLELGGGEWQRRPIFC